MCLCLCVSVFCACVFVCVNVIMKVWWYDGEIMCVFASIFLFESICVGKEREFENVIILMIFYVHG